MLIYEVNLEVEEDAKFGFAGWLPGHIDQILKLPGFRGAQWFFRNHQDEDRPPADTVLWTIQYIIDDQKHLDDYLADQAPKLRQEAIDKFGDKFKASRRVLRLLHVAGGLME